MKVGGEVDVRLFGENAAVQSIDADYCERMSADREDFDKHS